MRRVVLALIACGCGRIGFDVGTQHGDGNIPNGDSLLGGDPDGGAACVQSTFDVSQTAGVASGNPTIAWNGSVLGIAWIEDPTGAMTGSFRTATLDGALTFTKTLIQLPMGERDIAIVPDAATFRLALGSTMGSAHRQVFRSSDGAAPIAVTSLGKDNFRPRLSVIAPGVTGYLFVEQAASNYTAYFSVVDGAGTKIVDDVVVITGIGGPYTLDADYDGTAITSFFYAGDVSSGSIQMVRSDTTGKLLAGPITIASSLYVNSIGVARAGDRHLVSWIDSGGIVHIAYVGNDGSLVHPIVTRSGGSSFAFDIASYAGPGYDVVAWSDAGNIITYILAMNRDGTPGATRSITSALNAAVTWTGSAWAVAYQSGTPTEIFAGLLCP